MTNEQNDWDIGLKKLERDLNATVSKATGKTPYEALYGFIPRFDEGKAREITSNSETYRLPEVIQAEARESILSEQKRYKERYDRNKYTNVRYQLGDIVFVKRNPTATGQSTKLQAKFSGPMVIIDSLPSDTYRVKRLNETKDRGYVTTAHVSQLKIWKGGEESESESDREADSESEKDVKYESEIDDCVIETSTKTHVENKETNPKENEKENVRERRKRSRPVKLKDYECT